MGERQWYMADDLREVIRRQAGDSVTQWAKANGVSQSYVAKVLRGELAISKKLAKKIGFERRVHFVACQPEKEGA